MITAYDYFKAYPEHPAITGEIHENACDLLERVLKLLSIAGTHGWEPTVNPNTGTWISGEMNGGWRPPECVIGAPRSTHKQGRGIDISDPYGKLDKWLMTVPGLNALVKCGLWIDHPGWTDGWSHLQSVLPGNP